MIHKGYIPNREEAIAFGENVYSAIVETFLKLKTECNDHIQNVIMAEMVELKSICSKEISRDNQTLKR